MSQLERTERSTKSPRGGQLRTPTRLVRVPPSNLNNLVPASPHANKLVRQVIHTPSPKLNESSTISQAYSPNKSKSRVILESSTASNINSPDVAVCLYRLFGLEPTDSRMCMLSHERLSSTIERIYSYVFNRNTELLRHDLLQKEMERQQAFVKDIWQWATTTYLQKQLAHYNIGVLVHSLVYFIDKEPNLQLKMFCRFVQQQYRYKELLFFLFGRVMIETELAVTFDRRKTVGVENLHLSENNIKNVIMSIAGKHLDILTGLYEIFSPLVAGGKKISVYKCLETLVQDYRAKRPASNPHPRQSPSKKKEPAPYEKIFDSIESDVLSLRQKKDHSKHLQSSPISVENESSWSMEESTVLVIPLSQTKFWCQPPFVEGEALLHCLEHKHLLQAVLQKMRSKVTEFIGIMYSDADESMKISKERFHELLNDRACSLVAALFRMDKLLWMRLLCIDRPNYEQLEHIESLQLALRKIIKTPQQPKAISELCKRVLTTSELRTHIEKLIVD